MPDVPSTLENSPMMSVAQFASPSINQILNAAYTDGVAIGQETSPTLFDRNQFALSVFPVDVNGVQVAAVGFTVGLMRSIDGGQTYQLFSTHTTAEVVIPQNLQIYRWKVRLLTKGANDIRVRMI